MLINRSRSRLLAAVSLCALVLPSSGCIPGVAWLPDSSGFIYTDHAKCTRLMHYDLKERKAHVLVEDTGAGTLWPAVSPDGRRIAVARLNMTKGRKETSLQVVLYDRDGKERKHSSVFDWMRLPEPAQSGPAAADTAMLPQLFWPPRGDKVLVHTFGHVGLYDTRADRLTYTSDGVLLIFGSTPVRPDGAGFLVMKNAIAWMNWRDHPEQVQDHDPHFAFVTWDGKEKPLRSPALLLDLAALKKEKDLNKLVALLNPELYDSGWDGSVAWVRWNVDKLRYRTDRGEAVLDNIKPRITPGGALVMREWSFPTGGARIRFMIPGWDARNPDKATTIRVEAVPAAGNRQATAVIEGNSSEVLIASPDGKFTALRSPELSNQTAKAAGITVVSAKAEVVARIPVRRE